MDLYVCVCTQQGIEYVKGIVCEHWMHSYSNVRVHVYSDLHSHGA